MARQRSASLTDFRQKCRERETATHNAPLATSRGHFFSHWPVRGHNTITCSSQSGQRPHRVYNRADGILCGDRRARARLITSAREGSIPSPATICRYSVDARGEFAPRGCSEILQTCSKYPIFRSVVSRKLPRVTAMIPRSLPGAEHSLAGFLIPRASNLSSGKLNFGRLLRCSVTLSVVQSHGSFHREAGASRNPAMGRFNRCRKLSLVLPAAPGESSGEVGSVLRVVYKPIPRFPTGKLESSALDLSPDTSPKPAMPVNRRARNGNYTADASGDNSPGHCATGRAQASTFAPSGSPVRTLSIPGTEQTPIARLSHGPN